MSNVTCVLNGWKNKPNQIHVLWPWELMPMNRFPVTDINIVPVEFFWVFSSFYPTWAQQFCKGVYYKESMNFFYKNHSFL